MAKLRKAEIIARLTGAGKTPPTGKASFDDMTVVELRAFAAAEHVDLTAPVTPPPKKRSGRTGAPRSRKQKSRLKSFVKGIFGRPE